MDLQSGVGPQVLSNMRSNPATTLGCGKRFNYDFVKRAKAQPGAGEYKSELSACGKQALSKKKSLPLYSFGTSDRDQAAKVYMSREHEKGQKGDFSPGPTTAQQVWFLVHAVLLAMSTYNPLHRGNVTDTACGDLLIVSCFIAI